MTELGGIFVPRAGEARPYKHLYEKWREEKTAAEPEFKIENVRFEHNPEWRSRFWSIQSAHDRGHWGWHIVGTLFFIAQWAAMFIGFFIGARSYMR